MSGGYVIARENFKEAEKHVSAETEPVMFNLLYGLLSLTEQIESDFATLNDALAALRPPPAAARAGRAKMPAAGERGRAAAKKPSRGGTARKGRR
jgi:hypothetical protein